MRKTADVVMCRRNHSSSPTPPSAVKTNQLIATRSLVTVGSAEANRAFVDALTAFLGPQRS